MQKTSLSLGRLLVMVTFALSCFGLLLFLWLAFGGATPLKPAGYRVDLLVPEATTLALQSDVRVSGVSVGKVELLERAGNRTRATIEIDAKHAPLRSDVKAILRQKTLLGETFVELTPGSASAPSLPEGATLRRASVRPTVELDEVLRSLDARSRDDLQEWLQAFSRSVDGRAADVNDAVGALAPLAVDGGDVLTALDAERSAVRALLRDGGTVLGTVGAQAGDVRQLVRSGKDVLDTTSSRREDLRRTVRSLPPLLAGLRRAAASASVVAEDLVPAARDLRPVARELEPTLRGGARLGDDLERLSRDLRPVIAAGRGGLPAATRLLDRVRPLLPQLDGVTRITQPVAGFLSAYRREFTQSWAKVASATDATAPVASGREVNYLRLTAPLWNETTAYFEPRAPSNRANPYPAPGGLGKLSVGALEAFDCSHLDNPVQVPPIGSPPPCLQQQPYDAGNGAARFPLLRPADRP